MHASLRTERLVMRRWRESDRAPFAALNADPEVMRHFPSTLSRTESDALVDRIEERFAANGFGFWALELADSGRFIGFTGLSSVGFAAPFTPAVEVAWRLARPAWGRGYASEAARTALSVGFERYGLTEVVAFTPVSNERSQAVMRRIGMTHDPNDDFDHPLLPKGHVLARHVLYRTSLGG
ncbi:MAG TPA: GNAT family N-acetyltransferase [Thermomonospora sp.]|nr:GNAT family N-acetyltransferase [Thermomonospora sp.]